MSRAARASLAPSASQRKNGLRGSRECSLFADAFIWGREAGVRTGGKGETRIVKDSEGKWNAGLGLYWFDMIIVAALEG